eukprot:10189459-Ditylum_brightwellii.AAC.1
MESLKTNVNGILTLLQDTNLQRSSNSNNRSRNYCQYCPRNTLQIFYCWSHGVTNGEHHTSTNCSNKKQDTETVPPFSIEWAVARADWNDNQGGKTHRE